MTPQQYKNPKIRASILLKDHRNAEIQLQAIRNPPLALNIEIGLILKTRRKALNMTAIELGSKTGVQPTYINRLEKGVINPTIETLNKLADGLGCEISFELKKKKSIFKA